MPAPVSTKEVERSKSHTSVTNKAQDPKQKNFRSAAMGYEVQLSQALNSSGATPSSRLKVPRMAGMAGCVLHVRRGWDWSWLP